MPSSYPKEDPDMKLSARIACVPVLLGAAAAASSAELVREPVTTHPIVSISAEAVGHARERVKKDPIAKAWFDGLTSSASKWMDKTPEWVHSVVPEEAACFAYGLTGCPICGKGWAAESNWWDIHASFDTPGKVVCFGGHTLPDAEHPDTGKGYKGPDGRIHYFAGSYNTYVAETLSFKIAEPCSHLWLLGRDDKAGRLAVTVLDELARIYPTCTIGSWDYPSDHNEGRFNRPFYQTARTLVRYVDMFDYLYDHPAMDEPSCVKGLTRRQNIEKNMLLDGGKFCYDYARKMGGLANGEADFVRGALAVGVLLGIPEYVQFAVDGPSGIRNLMANNIDRDGGYFETSLMYGMHTRNLYVTFAEPLLRCRNSFLPNGLNLYDDPRLEACLYLPQMRASCLGHEPRFGDTGPDTEYVPAPYHPASVVDIAFLERLAVRASDPQKRERYRAALALLLTQDKDFLTTQSWFSLFHAMEGLDAEELSAAGTKVDAKTQNMLVGCGLFGQKGLAILRRSFDACPQAAAFRYGPSLNHGHLDDLNVNYFAAGYEMTYDLGYKLASTHTQVGLAKQTIAHNSAVVNMKSQGGGMSGGSLYNFEEFAGTAVCDASSEVYAHAGVSMYRRLFALADGYALDVFRIKGGKNHDLPLHSLATKVEFGNVTLGEPQEGSLAGPEYKWGELQLNDGDLKGAPIKPYWVAPPGNGYGFLTKPRHAKVEGEWSATWNFDDKQKTQFTVLAIDEKGTSVASAVAPGLYPHLQKAAHVVRRRSSSDNAKLSSCFPSVWQAHAADQPARVKAVHKLSKQPLDADAPLALAVELAKGGTDLWLVSPDPGQAVEAELDGQSISWRGSIACVGVRDGRLASLRLLEGTSFSGLGWKVDLPSAAAKAKVVEKPGAGQLLALDGELAKDARYDGCPLYVSNDKYSRNSAYTVRECKGKSVAVEQSDTVLGRGVVDELIGTTGVRTLIPHEYAKSPISGHASSGYFKGKRLHTDDGAVDAEIAEVLFGYKETTVTLTSNAGLKKGQAFTYCDVQPGDTVSVHHWAEITRAGDGKYRVASNTDVTVKAPEDCRVETAKPGERGK